MQFSQLGKKIQFKATEGPSPSSQQFAITGAFSRQTKYKQDSAKWCTLTDSVVCYIAKETQPVNTIEKPTFRQMLQTFDSQYKLPGRTCVSQTAIRQLYSVKDDILKGQCDCFWLCVIQMHFLRTETESCLFIVSGCYVLFILDIIQMFKYSLEIKMY